MLLALVATALVAIALLSEELLPRARGVVVALPRPPAGRAADAV